MGLSNELSCEAGSFSCCHNPSRFLQPEVLRLYFPCAGTPGCTVCLTLQLFPLVCLPANVEPSRCHLVVSSPPQLPVSAPFTSLEAYFSLISQLSDFHTVQFSGNSGCFLFLNLLLSLFWLCKKAKRICLCLHLGWKFFPKIFFN